MTTDHPNGGPFTDYPRVLAWLYSKKAREATLKKCHKSAKKKSLLPSIDRELSLYEIAIMTRAGTAKTLGLPNKGHLGVGADADAAIFNINPETLDIAQKFRTARKAFSKVAYTIKDGVIVVKDGEVVNGQVPGRTIWVDSETKEPCKIDDAMKRRFKEYWTIEYENYAVTDHYVKVSDQMKIKASV
jgi:formylmethanofuran dehydrogenase subunit A